MSRFTVSPGIFDGNYWIGGYFLKSFCRRCRMVYLFKRPIDQQVEPPADSSPQCRLIDRIKLS